MFCTVYSASITVQAYMCCIHIIIVVVAVAVVFVIICYYYYYYSEPFNNQSTRMVTRLP